MELLFIYLQIGLVCAKSFSQNEKSKFFFEHFKIHANEISNKTTSFRLNETETNKFHTSLKLIHQLNDCFIRNISYFQILAENKNSKIEFINYIEKSINIISEKRKDAVNKHTCQYEIIKLHELFYHALYHIVKHDEKLQVKLLNFVEKTIMPVIEEIEVIINTYKFMYLLNSIDEDFCHKKIDDKNRYYLLMNFLSNFISEQNDNSSLYEIENIISKDNLLSICSNIFIRFYLYNRKKIGDFYKSFKSQEYLLSTQYVDILFCEGDIVGCVFEARVQFRNFFSQYNLKLEEEFLIQGSIVPIFDMMNKFASKLKLDTLGYGRNQ